MDGLPMELFPVEFTTGFTTDSSLQDVNKRIAVLQLSDVLLTAYYITHDSPPHPVVQKCGKNAVQCFYPAGSINPRGEIKGGFGMYLPGPDGRFRLPDGTNWQDRLQTAKEVVFSYRVMFQDGFAWAKGGKVPGIYGGIGDSAYKCTGGKTEDQKQCRCFNLRLMWRARGEGELYAYIPPLECNTRQLKLVPPYSVQNPDFGYSVGRGAFKFWTEEKGWNTVAERVKLNDVGCENGEVEVFVNGSSVIKAQGLVLRTSEESHCKGLHLQTFFGGKAPDWASPCDQYAWFCDISAAIVA